MSLGLVNVPHKINTRVLLTLEANLNKLFERNAKAASIPDNPDAQIIYHGTLYNSYLQITLDDNFLVYYNGILRSHRALRIRCYLSTTSTKF